MNRLLPIAIPLCVNFCPDAHGLEFRITEQPCSHEITSIVQQELNINIRPIPDGDVVTSACKAYPGVQDTTIVAYAHDQLDKQGNPVPDHKNYQVLLLNTRSRTVTYRFNQIIEEDAGTEVGEHSLWIDTAPYQLTDKLRAFGILKRIGKNSSRCAENMDNDYLDLFVPEGAVLHNVLNGFTLFFEKVSLDPDCSPAGSTDVRRTIRMGEHRENGYRDLIISTRLSPKIIYTQSLHYNGRQYETTTSEKKWQDWWEKQP